MRRSVLLLVLTLAGLAISLPAPDASAQRRGSARQARVRSGSATRQHTVRRGDTWVRIARRYGVDAWDLALANRSRPERTLRTGQVLQVPPEGVVYVRSRQSLSEVARAHDVQPEVLARLNGVRIGTTLRVGQRLVLPGYVDPTDPEVVDRDWGAPSQQGVARIRRRGELAPPRLVDGAGRVTREGLQQLAQLMRRHDQDDPALPHPRLVRLLAAISDHFGGREITLVSGRRPAGGRTRESSRHVSGHATDIRIEGVPARALWDYCRSLARTGCGFYPRSTFVHVDVRDEPAQWVDWSQPGRRSAYGNLRGPWRRACTRAHRGRGRPSPACSREGRQVTRPLEVPAEVELTPEAQALLPIVPDIPAEPEELDEGDEAEILDVEDEGDGDS
jgi:LysM repeat protein